MTYEVHHLASYLALGATLIFIAIRTRKYFNKKTQQHTKLKPWTAYVYSFLCGALLVNGLVHFIHGASGEDFAAPFGFATNNVVLSHLSNVLWGSLNLSIAYVAGRKVIGTRQSYQTVAFFAGITAMGVVLCFVFS